MKLYEAGLFAEDAALPTGEGEEGVGVMKSVVAELCGCISTADGAGGISGAVLPTNISVVDVLGFGGSVGGA